MSFKTILIAASIVCSLTCTQSSSSLYAASQTTIVENKNQPKNPESISWFKSFYNDITNFFSKNDESEITFYNAIKKDYITVPISQHHLAHLNDASTLLVSCVDFRLRDETIKLMENVFKLQDQYDEVVIPGATLSLVQKEHSQHAHWSKTIMEVVGLLKKLHNIKRVIFLDHLGCGAYKLIHGEEVVKTVEKETAAHKAVFKEAREIFAKHFPQLEIHTLLMGLDGKVEICH